MKRHLIFLIAGLFVLAACYPPSAPQQPVSVAPAEVESAVTVETAPPAPAPGVLLVDPSVDLGPISPYLYGTNYGPMHAVPIEMMPDMVQSRFTALRWPGGAWTDEVDMQPFQIDQFVWFYNQLGALPTVSVRLLNGSPETAANVVRYAIVE